MEYREIVGVTLIRAVLLLYTILSTLYTLSIPGEEIVITCTRSPEYRTLGVRGFSQVVFQHLVVVGCIAQGCFRICGIRGDDI